MDYPILEKEVIEKLTPLSDRILVEWETNKKDMLNGLLVRPDTHIERYYTGIILKKGIYVDSEDLQEGARIFFEQFSNFEKFQSLDGKKRFAIVREGACLSVIPKRINLKCSDWAEYGTGDEA